MRKRREDWITRLGRNLDLPCEAMPGGFGLTLSGTGQLTLRGCRRILAYTPECVRLSVGRRAVAVTGERVLCTVFEAGSVTVEGRIDAIRLEKNGEDDGDEG